MSGTEATTYNDNNSCKGCGSGGKDTANVSTYG
jgi:hypothetical protein